MKTDYDVIVVGGGPSGFIAAIASARVGAKTLLIERYGFLGGMATAATLGPISPFHFNDEQVIEGIPQEFVDRMVAAGGSTGHMKCTNPYGSGSYLCFYDHQVYKWIALEMVLEAGVTLLMHSFFVGVDVENNRVRGVHIVSKSGSHTFNAKVVVDATGDGDVAALAGARYVIGRDGDHTLQPVTLMFEMANVDTDRVKAYMDTHSEDFEWASECVPLQPLPAQLDHPYFVGQGFLQAVRQGLQSRELYLGRDSILFLTSVHPKVLHFNSTRVVGINGTNVEDLTRGEIDARRQVMSLSRYLIRYIPGFRDAYVSTTGMQVGIRETRHILGEYVLSGEDALTGRKFDDVIARGYFPIDIHNTGGKTGYGHGGLWMELRDSYDIPYRCLLPVGLQGIVMAGRSISATHEAHGSLRTQGSVMAIGQAAGTAAALSALQGVEPRDLEIKVLQDRLLADGACLWRNPQKMHEQAHRAAEAVRRALADGRISGRYIAIDLR